jgi:hypothetical protein
MPAKAGIQCLEVFLLFLDPGLRRGDGICVKINSIGIKSAAPAFLETWDWK